MKTSVLSFPFDLFGTGSTAEGVHLLADELAEILADNRREKTPSRAKAYTSKVRTAETTFATLDDYARWRQTGHDLARPVLTRGDFLVWLTGSHLGALPVYDELGPETLVVQFDAHLDIHRFTDTTRELSHGNFLLHVAGEMPQVVNVGHRELLLTPKAISDVYARALAATDLALDGASVVADLRDRVARADRVILDIDCDVFDPAFFPATGRPVPFGPSPAAVLAVIDEIFCDKVRGLMLSEFDPGRDRDDRSLATLVWLVEHLLLRTHEQR